MQNMIEATREIIETAATVHDMHQRLIGIALDFKGMFPGHPLGQGRFVACDDNREKVVLEAGHVVAYFYKPGTGLPGLTGLLIDAKSLDANKAGKQDTVKVGIGVYTPSPYLPDNKLTMSDMSFVTTKDVDEVRKLLEFF